MPYTCKCWKAPVSSDGFCFGRTTSPAAMKAPMRLTMSAEPVTGDPRTQRRVAWGRLVTGEDVTAVLSHADQWPLLPHSHVELSSPVPARSAQEWFNALPDDTAKSIVNMR
eukprot:364743-Chlamydomonas_euryale.AAC.76